MDLNVEETDEFWEGFSQVVNQFTYPSDPRDLDTELPTESLPDWLPSDDVNHEEYIKQVTENISQMDPENIQIIHNEIVGVEHLALPNDGLPTYISSEEHDDNYPTLPPTLAPSRVTSNNPIPNKIIAHHPVLPNIDDAISTGGSSASNNISTSNAILASNTILAPAPVPHRVKRRLPEDLRADRLEFTWKEPMVGKLVPPVPRAKRKKQNEYEFVKQ